MKYFSVILIIMGLLLSSLAFADLSSEVGTLSTQIVGTELTGVAGSMLKNERVNFYVQNGEKTQVFGLVTEKRKVVSLTEEELTDPSLKVFSDLDTIMALKNSAAPAEDLKKALDEKKITYEAVGFFNKIKFGFSNFFMKIFGPKESKDEKEELKNETKEEKKQEQEQKKDETQEKVEDKKEEKTDDSPEVNETSSNDQEEGDDNSNQKETEVESETEVEVEVEEEFEGETHTVLLENKGFNPSSLTIKVGDKVKWKVSRTGNFKNGMILGTQNCVGVKSKILNNGEEFEWEFKKAETCTFVDGIITTQVSKVIVEE